ncbi:MAG TPA: hypothetical protein VKZ96_06675 [Thermomicrobiales bacterium]|nr:hypothetical protein [Thermomicrobiales bacterium]
MYRTLRYPLGDLEVRATLAWLVVAVLLLGVSIYVVVPAYLPDWTLARQSVAVAIILAGAALSLILHELAHFVTARRDGNAYYAFSPQLVGALPDTVYEAENPRKEVRVGIAGPVASWALAGVFGLLWWLANNHGGRELTVALALVCLANVGLATVSLMPGYPFDGGRVMRGFIWHLTGDLMTATKVVGYLGYAVMMGLMTIGVLLVVSGGTAAIWGVWVLMTAYVINRSVGAGVSHVFWSIQSQRLRVDDLFIGGTRRIQSTVLIDDAIERLLEGYNDGPMLVFEGDRAVGLVDLGAIRPVPRKLWRERTVGDVMQSLDGIGRVRSTASLAELIVLLPPEVPGIALIERDGRIIGATDRRDVVRRLQDYLAAERLEKLRRGRKV